MVFLSTLQYLDILSETKLIKPAALGKPAPETESCLASPETSEDPADTDSCVQFQNVGVEFQTNILMFLCFEIILKLNDK